LIEPIRPKEVEKILEIPAPNENLNFFEKEGRIFENPKLVKTKKIKEEKRRGEGDFVFSDLFFPTRFSFNFKPQKTAFQFAFVSVIITLIIGISAFGAKGIGIKGKVLGVSQKGYSNLNSAVDGIKNQNFETSRLEFEKSYENFSQASSDLDEMGKVFIEISRFFPFSSKLSSGKNLVEAGKHVAIAGKSLSEIIETLSSVKNPLGKSENKSISFLEMFQSTEKEIRLVNQELQQVQENLDKINIDDLPTEKKQQFLSLKEKLPEINGITGDFLDNSGIFVDLLGGNGPRKYLFLFQNNQEMRATGGFIGSYGLLDISGLKIPSI
jgi:exonuclease VII small subunit